MKSILVTALFLGALLSFSSCQKEDLLKEDSGAVPALSTTLDYELIGQHHNAVLQAVGNDPAFSPQLVQSPNAQVLALTAKYTEQASACNANCHQLNLVQLMSDGYQRLQGIDTPADWGDDAFAQGHINAQDRAAAHQLSAIVATAKTSSQTAFANSLKSYEAGLKSQNGLSQTGRNCLMAGSAVMRYSDAFWRGVRASGPGNPWYTVDRDRVAMASGPVPWYVADLMGALAALETPAVYVLGPYSAIPAAIAVGAIMSIVS